MISPQTPNDSHSRAGSVAHLALSLSLSAALVFTAGCKSTSPAPAGPEAANTPASGAPAPGAPAVAPGASASPTAPAAVPAPPAAAAAAPAVAPGPPPPPPPPAFVDVTIPAGKSIPFRINQTLDSATTQQGEPISGVVGSNVVVNGVVVIPQGTPVSGRVSAAHEAAHYKGSSLLSIELTSMRVRGQSVGIAVTPYSKQGKGRGKNTAIKAGAGAGGGALIGGLLGGGKGAAIGALAGGGAGMVANGVTRGEQVQIPSESLIQFRLVNSIVVSVPNRPASDPSAAPADSSGRRPLPPPQ